MLDNPGAFTYPAPTPGPGFLPADAAHADAVTGHFTAADGADIYFADSGGPGPILFYIYGLACSIAHWKYALNYFGGAPGRRDPNTGHLSPSTQHRQVWMDFRGHGRSDAPKENERLTIASLVSDIQDLCQHRGISRATFLGQSMGGSVALALAAARPDLVSALVLLTSPCRDPGPNFAIQPFGGLAWRAMLGLHKRAPHLTRRGSGFLKALMQQPALTNLMVPMIRAGGFNANLSQTADIREYVEELLKIDLHLFLDLAEDLTRFDVANLERRIECPSLIIAGAADLIVPLPESERLASLLPASEMLVVPHGSHCPHFDDPMLVNQGMAHFFDRHGL